MSSNVYNIELIYCPPYACFFYLYRITDLLVNFKFNCYKIPHHAVEMLDYVRWQNVYQSTGEKKNRRILWTFNLFIINFGTQYFEWFEWKMGSSWYFVECIKNGLGCGIFIVNVISINSISFISVSIAVINRRRRGLILAVCCDYWDVVGLFGSLGKGGIVGQKKKPGGNERVFCKQN